MDPVRVCVVSDSHLAPTAAEADANWDAVVDHVAATTPDLVLHLGDLCLDGDRDLEHGHRQLERLPVRWRAVPGNHDIGDNPWPGGRDEHFVTDARRARWVETIGDDWWIERCGDWTLVAVNAQLFGSGLAAEEEQRTWLASLDWSSPAALVIHKPIAAPSHEIESAPPYRFVPLAERSLLSGRAFDLVVSGHVHQYRCQDFDSTRHVWAPTSWAVLPDDAQPWFGEKRCGVVTFELGSSAGVEPTLIEPDGIRQLTLTEDLPNPYAH